MGQARVLITDDDDVALEMLNAALRDRYSITTAHSGKEALAQTAQQDFDMILLDVDMPEMDGYATCTALKTQRRTSEVPVLFLSARVSIEERLRGYRVGGTDYLTKPFDVLELMAKIELTVERRERNRMLTNKIEKAKHTAQAKANIYGEVGIVLALQRELGNCHEYAAIARAFFNALERMGFEGCLRLTGRQGVMSRSGQGECTALGNSLLDHLETIKSTKIQAVGDNTCFNYGNVLVLVRNLPMNPKSSQYGQDDLERLAHVRDNVAVMAEGIAVRLHAIDIEMEKSHFEHSQKLITAAREALAGISAQQRANSAHMGQVLQRMNSEVEASFIHLGLNEAQEEQLSSILKRHMGEAAAVFDRGNQIDADLHKLINKLHG